jgi:hypothetical protein
MLLSGFTRAERLSPYRTADRVPPASFAAETRLHAVSPIVGLDARPIGRACDAEFSRGASTR